jgi:hypothetical protein
MLSRDRNETVSFLKTCSRVSLSDFLLAEQNRAANLEKHISELVQELSENLVFIELARLLRANSSNVLSIEKGRGAADLSTPPKPYSHNHWRKLGTRRDLTRNELWTLMGIKAHANEDGVAPVTRRKIEEWSRLSRSGVYRGLKGLRAKGFIRSKRRQWDLLVYLQIPPLEFRSEGSQGTFSVESEGSQGTFSVESEGSQGTFSRGSEGSGGTISTYVKHVSLKSSTPHHQTQPPGLGHELNPKELATRKEISVGTAPRASGVRPEILERERKRRAAKNGGVE